MTKKGVALRIALAAALALALPAAPAAAGTLTVSPVLVELPPDGRPEVIRLHNPGPRPTLVQVEAIAWAEPDALDAAPRAAEVLAVPPVFELAPDGRQIIRLALRRPLAGPAEQAWRLLITEVPRATGPDTGGLTFAVRLNIPLFATPAGAAPDPVWTLRSAEGGAAELVLTNRGTTRLQIIALELRAPQRGPSLLASEEPVYALAGEARRWPLDRPLDRLPAGLEVHVETDRGAQVSPVAISTGR